MAAFIKGKDLCRGFFEQVAKPILDRRFPGLVYSAGLLGYGSDVLGYDDAVSTDHMWGPRFYLFLREEDKALQPQILEAFSQEFPYTYRGYSVHFSRPDPNDKGIRHAEAITQGQVDPLIFFHTFEEYLDFYLGTHHPETLTDVEWLSLPEHHLPALAKAEFYVDMLHCQERLEPLRFYPENVWLYLVASCWSLVAEEQAFVKRCASVGDSLGSALVCGRIAERLMRLCFLYCRQYAPLQQMVRHGPSAAAHPPGAERRHRRGCGRHGHRPAGGQPSAGPAAHRPAPQQPGRHRGCPRGDCALLRPGHQGHLRGQDFPHRAGARAGRFGQRPADWLFKPGGKLHHPV